MSENKSVATDGADTPHDDAEERPRLPLTRSEHVRNYLLGLGAISALVLGLIAQFRGEPVAEKTYETLQKNQNRQAKELNRIRMRLVYFQAWQEARTAMDLQHQLEALQKKYDALLAKRAVTKAADVTPPTKTAVKATSIAARLKVETQRVVDTQKRLLAEKKRRLAAERQRRELLRQVRQKTKQTQDADLPMLPARLK